VTTIYRRAGPQDVALLLRLLQEMAAEVGRSISGTEAALTRHGFGPEPRFRAVLAEADGQAAGFTLIFPEYSSWRGELGIYVQDLYVRPEARGTGVARALLAAAVQAASDWQPVYMTLMVDHRNEDARRWYDRQGFALRERGDLLILDRAALGRLAG
jgi:GNAT superfamily N-acetyltransferase